jgi:hypothetical protein
VDEAQSSKLKVQEKLKAQNLKKPQRSPACGIVL